MYIILWLLFGALVGWLASIVMQKNHNMGLIANIIVGLVGSALGMWLMGVLGFGTVDSFSFAGLLVSVGGAAILIAIISAFSRRR
ncbi:MAG: GlsB/YeaQ/YmgE family stress response membrane protein [Acholeplasmataceae bacterium]|nr:GlsB/YeaQ/YmgE family stress response membrane protein [Acholeplasmataceae bacterium]